MSQQKVYLNWSSGKDSALALHELLNNGVKVDRLITNINSHFNRVTMHGLRRELLERQFEAIQIPHQTIELPESPTMEEYESIMTHTVLDLKKEGFTHAAFGDIFLEDLKTYREEQLQKMGIACLFPIWKRDTHTIIKSSLNKGFETIVIAVNGSKLDASFCGRVIDESFIQDLPPDVDVCGENGEFHTFCFDGPIFKQPVSFKKGEIVTKTYPNPSNPEEETPYYFCELVGD